MAVYEYDSQNQELKRVAGGTLYADCPIGSYIPFGGTAIPTGWLLCNGQAVSRTDYAELFKVIGTAYGSGDGSTTFNIPDLREAVPKGAGLTSKSNNHLDADGLAVGEFLDDRIQEHSHSSKVNDTAGTSSNKVGYMFQPSSAFDRVPDDSTQSGRVGATTEVKSVGSNYIIKAKQIGVPADFASAIEDVIDEKFSYSTSEVNTGKKWIDGKDIYNKTYELTGSINNNSYTNVGITEPQNISKLLGYEIKGDNFSKFCYLGNIAPNIYNMACFEITSLNVNGMTCTLEYTKTTD